MLVSLVAVIIPFLALSNAVPTMLLTSRQASGAVMIHPGNDTSRCLDLTGNVRENNQAVDVYECNGSTAQNWIIPAQDTAGAIKLADADFCLDAGSPPFATRQMKIYQCYDPSTTPQQDWYFTDDDHFALYNQNPGYCLAYTGYADGNSNAQVIGCGGNYQAWSTSAVA